MEDNDDDFFSDDGFDDIPPGTLFQLEQNAYRATQAPKPAQQHHQQQQPQHSVSDVKRSSRPFFDQNRGAFSDNAFVSNASLQPPPALHTGLSNEYDVWDIGELDAEVLDNGVPIQSNAALDQAATFATAQHQPNAATATAVAEDDYGDLLDPMEVEEDGASHFQDLHRAYAELSEKVFMQNHHP